MYGKHHTLESVGPCVAHLTKATASSASSQAWWRRGGGARMRSAPAPAPAQPLSTSSSAPHCRPPTPPPSACRFTAQRYQSSVTPITYTHNDLNFLLWGEFVVIKPIDIVVIINSYCIYMINRSSRTIPERSKHGKLSVCVTIRQSSQQLSKQRNMSNLKYRAAFTIILINIKYNRRLQRLFQQKPQ